MKESRATTDIRELPHGLNDRAPLRSALRPDNHRTFRCHDVHESMMGKAVAVLAARNSFKSLQFAAVHMQTFAAKFIQNVLGEILWILM
jgi:hypothetical protein